MGNLVKVFGDSFVSRATVFRWQSQFVVDEELIEDEHWKIGNNENMAQVAAVLKDDHCASCTMISDSTGILKTIVHHMLSDDLKK